MYNLQMRPTSPGPATSQPASQPACPGAVVVPGPAPDGAVTSRATDDRVEGDQASQLSFQRAQLAPDGSIL